MKLRIRSKLLISYLALRRYSNDLPCTQRQLTPRPSRLSLLDGLIFYFQRGVLNRRFRALQRVAEAKRTEVSTSSPLSTTLSPPDNVRKAGRRSSSVFFLPVARCAYLFSLSWPSSPPSCGGGDPHTLTHK